MWSKLTAWHTTNATDKTPKKAPVLEGRDAFPVISRQLALQINSLNMRQISCMMKYSYKWIVLMKFLNEINEIPSLSKANQQPLYQERRLHYTHLTHSPNRWVGQNCPHWLRMTQKYLDMSLRISQQITCLLRLIPVLMLSPNQRMEMGGGTDHCPSSVSSDIFLIIVNVECHM